jgi:7-cyano-7-deazaguanine synthase
MITGLLLSGGMDSIALAYWKRPQIALTIDYGQVANEAETRAAATVCSSLQIQHEIIRVNCRDLGSGDLVNGPQLAIAPMSEWWPFRNQLLITLAAMKALYLGIEKLLVGAVKTDRAHVDGSGEFFTKIDELLNMQEGRLELAAPAINLTTAELVVRSGVPFELLCWAHSCHRGNYACGLCRGCAKHYATMAELGHEPY